MNAYVILIVKWLPIVHRNPDVLPTKTLNGAIEDNHCRWAKVEISSAIAGI